MYTNLSCACECVVVLLCRDFLTGPRVAMRTRHGMSMSDVPYVAVVVAVAVCSTCEGEGISYSSRS